MKKNLDRAVAADLAIRGGVTDGLDRKLFQGDHVGRKVEEKGHEKFVSVAEIITGSKSVPFWRNKGFWKDGNPLSYEEFCHTLLKIEPSAKQIEVAYKIVGTDPFDWDVEHQKYVFAIGQGGGKNLYIIAPVTTYIAYKIANMRDPQLYFSRFFPVPLTKQKKFEMSNSSMVTAVQAKNVHFDNMQNMITNCITPQGDNWFAKYCGMDVRSEGIGDIKSHKIEIPTVPGAGKIILHSYDSKPQSVEGLSIILGVVDEPSRAETAATFADCLKLWKTITGNINTRFPRGVGKAIAFSYINISEYDFTYSEIKKADEERKQLGKSITYTVNLSTFDVNPTASLEDESIKADFRNDPSDAEARYLGKKGASKEAFYQPHVDAIAKCFTNTLVSPLTYHLDEVVMQGDKFVTVFIDKIVPDGKQRTLAFDAGETSDSFVLKCGYTEMIDERRDSLFIDNEREMVVVNKRPVVDIVIVWQPKAGVRVNYVNVGDVIAQLLDAFPNIVSAKSDKWQSVKLSQEIKARGVEYKNIKSILQPTSASQGTQSDTLSFSSKMQLRLYTKLRWMMWNNVPVFYKDMTHTVIHNGVRRTVGEHNVFEHEHLLRENAKIVHPPDGSKDLADVDAIIVNDLINQEIKTLFTSNDMATVTDEKILMMAEKYMEFRQLARNEGSNEHAHEVIEGIGAKLGLNTEQSYRLKRYVESIFQGT